MSYASQNWTKDLLSKTLKSAKDNNVFNEIIENANINFKEDNYSTEEIIIGKWVDGRPIYRTLVPTTLPNVTKDGTYVQNRISFNKNIKHTVNVYGIAYDSGFTSDFSYLTNNTLFSLSINYDISNKCINVNNCTSGWNGFSIYVVMEYTKTTDAENSYNPSMLVDNSLSATATDDEINSIFS